MTDAKTLARNTHLQDLLLKHAIELVESGKAPDSIWDKIDEEPRTLPSEIVTDRHPFWKRSDDAIYKDLAKMSWMPKDLAGALMGDDDDAVNEAREIIGEAATSYPNLLVFDNDKDLEGAILDQYRPSRRSRGREATEAVRGIVAAYLERQAAFNSRARFRDYSSPDGFSESVAREILLRVKEAVPGWRGAAVQIFPSRGASTVGKLRDPDMDDHGLNVYVQLQYGPPATEGRPSKIKVSVVDAVTSRSAERSWAPDNVTSGEIVRVMAGLGERVLLTG